MPNRSTLTRRVVRGAAAAAAAGTLAGVAAVGAATYMVRRLVTPDRTKVDDVLIRAVVPNRDGAPVAVVLEANEETTVPGRYGLWLDEGRGHARIGAILAVDVPARTVTREVLGMDAGELAPGPARFNGYYFATPPAEALGLPARDVQVSGPLGDMPAWLIPGGTRWAILVHGRGALRHECLRAVPVLHELGLTTLIASYRNDEDAPPSPDGRYALGLAEWADVDAAIRYALDHGATSVVLVGWSMGGALVLQTLARSPLARHVSHVVLDAPVVSWVDVVAHHARLGRLPSAIVRLAPYVLSSRHAVPLVGIADPLHLSETEWRDRAGELTTPILLIHSVDDEFVPVGPSIDLADTRPDLVRFVPWRLARHTKEWNTDPDRWDALVREFLDPGPTDS